MTDFWTNKRVVVTGGRGFVGSFLVDMLIEAGAAVTVMDTGARGHNHNPAAHYTDKRQTDVTSQGNCEVQFRYADAVFNLAAHVGGLYYNIAHQAEQFWGNAQLLAPPALAAAQAGVPIYLQVSTVCCYAHGHNNPAREYNGHIGEPEQGNAGYAWAKRMGERICHWAFETLPTRYVIVRPTNIYGRRDYFDDTAHVIPALIRKFAGKMDPVPVYGGSQRREFLYVEDAARGMLAVAEHGERGEAYNLGTNGETQVSIAELAEMIQELVGYKGAIDYIEGVSTGDVARRTDCTKIHALGWKHQVELWDGLKWTVEWSREKADG